MKTIPLTEVQARLIAQKKKSISEAEDHIRQQRHGIQAIMQLAAEDAEVPQETNWSLSEDGKSIVEMQPMPQVPAIGGKLRPKGKR